MQRTQGRFIYSASDLNAYLECKRLSELEALVALGRLTTPDDDDERAELIRRKGEEHEARYLEHLRERHGEENVRAFERGENSLDALRRADAQTLDAMKRGVPVIYQATFFDEQFVGHADFLRRIDQPSKLGTWSYEVLDTKLALKPRPYFLIQLCNYGEHLERLQGLMPVHGAIVLGDGTEERYRLHDYLAYYRHLKRRFVEFAGVWTHSDARTPDEYPHKREHCTVCAWNDACTAAREADDHLSLVARMRRDQIAKFDDRGVKNVAALARANDADRPPAMNAATFDTLRRQAKLQVQGRSNGPVYELLPHDPPLGFAWLPTPAAGDVFFDMEGDPLFEPARGLEYLFGCWMPGEDPPYRAFWALDRSAEKRAFEEFVDFIAGRRRVYPAMHVYHYANYEKTALRRLAQVHCTREDAIDDLLRGEVLVDLYTVVRQALAISEPRYGLKNLEKFYDLVRGTDVRKGDESIVMFERWLLSRDETILRDIEAYNRDDCRSTALLREWLLKLRLQAQEQLKAPFPFRPVRSPREPCHVEFTAGCARCETRQKSEREERRRSDLERTLLAGVLSPQSEDEYRIMDPDKRARYLLGNLLAYHRREEKPAYWAYFDRRERVDEFESDREAIGGLRFQEDVPVERIKNSSIYTFVFPDQPNKLEAGDTPHDPKTEPYKTTGTILAVDFDRNELRLKWTGTRDQARAITALMPRHPLPTAVQHEAIGRIAERFVGGTLSRDYPATFALLMAGEPHIAGIAPGSPVQPAPASTAAVSRLVAALERSYLFVQGPPGSGKSTKSASIIADLLERGKRIGATATGHKAIHHLLHKVEREMHARGRVFRGLYKHSDGNPNSVYHSEMTPSSIVSTGNNAQFDGADYDLAAGTSWLFAREENAGAFDYLFIDEAGQVSLADAIAVSACARNVVLLGDPSQLAQVSQGVHPLHAGDSVLQHLLGEAQTVLPERGVFLDVSYRMQPDICHYVSDASYDGRLEPDPRTSLHAITVNSRRRAGLEYLPVDHAGNASSSREEADRIVDEVRLLLQGQLTDSWPPARCGIPRAMTQRDVIVVTPYNAQRRLVSTRLKAAGLDDVCVGTVDKFQGQEAAVVFYSMATSSGDDVPRDVAFLFERNRFNVAVSRARALSVLVCSPRLLDLDCRTPAQMTLVNLLCAFAEAAA